MVLSTPPARTTRRWGFALAGVVLYGGATLALALAAYARGSDARDADGGAAHSAYSEAPPPAHTGGFGEPSCHACHFDNQAGAPGGSVSLDGIPDGYNAGQLYRVTVEVARRGIGRAGFQLSARYADGARAGTQAGVLRALDDRASVTEAASGVQYAHHMRPGTALSAPDTGRWVLEWIAPPAATIAPVVFSVAANAANDDNSEFGDFIYVLRLMRHPREK